MRRRSVGAIAAIARAAPPTASGDGSTPSASAVTMDGIPTASRGSAASRSAPSSATSRRTPSDSATATAMRSWMSITSVEGRSFVTVASAIHGSRSSRRSAAPASSVKTFVSWVTRRDAQHLRPGHVRGTAHLDRASGEERAAGERHGRRAQHHHRDEHDGAHLAEAVAPVGRRRHIGERHAVRSSSRRPARSPRSGGRRVVQRGVGQVDDLGRRGDRSRRPRRRSGERLSVGHHRTLRSASLRAPARRPPSAPRAPGSPG